MDRFAVELVLLYYVLYSLMNSMNSRLGAVMDRFAAEVVLLYYLLYTLMYSMYSRFGGVWTGLLLKLYYCTMYYIL